MPKQTLAEAIYVSADWSTSNYTCTKCAQSDLRERLEPIIRALREKLPCSEDLLEKLEKMFRDEELSSELIRVDFSESSYTSQNDIRTILRRELQPVINVLEKAHPDEEVQKQVSKLRNLYEE